MRVQAREVHEVLVKGNEVLDVKHSPDRAAGPVLWSEANPSVVGPSGRLLVAVFFCLMSPLLFGYGIAFTSPTKGTMEGDRDHGRLPPSELVIFSDSAMNWYASLLNVGCIVGAFSGAFMSERFGRKSTLAFTALPHLVSWLGTSFSRNGTVLIALRLLLGWGIGLGSAVAPTYLGEVSPMSLRGAFGAMNQLSVTIGIFMANVMGTYVFVVDEDTSTFSQWRYMCWFACGLAAALAIVNFMPESPTWLVKKGHLDRAMTSLKSLRKGDASFEANQLRASAVAPALAQGSPDISTTTPGLGTYRKSLLIGVGLCFFQQCSGINAIIMYTTTICKEAGVSNPAAAGVVSMGFQVVLTGVSCLLMEKAGRRFLLLFACSCMTIAHVILTYYYFAQQQGWPASSTMALCALAIYLLGFSLGMGPIPWLILAEVFPPEIRGTASSIATATNWTCSFVITLIFLPLEAAIGKSFAFLLFAVVCLCALIFVAVLVPETKGRSVDQVLAILNGGSPNIIISLQRPQRNDDQAVSTQ